MARSSPGPLAIAGGNLVSGSSSARGNSKNFLLASESPEPPRSTSPTHSARSFNSKKSCKFGGAVDADGNPVEESAHDKVMQWRADQGRREAMKKRASTTSTPSPPPTNEVSAPGEGTVTYSGSCKKTRMKSLPGSHWTENPMAMEMMQEMSFSYSVPALQPRLTAFHGTRIPVLMLYYLLSTEVGRLAVLDTFWKRIVQHPMVWQGIYCRDYGSPRCVWRTLHGRVGSDKCLCHLGATNPPLFAKFCKQITAIPGRSSEELLDNYRSWRADLLQQDAARAKKNITAEELAMQALASESHATALPLRDTAVTAEPQQSWSVRAHASYGLGPGHGLRIQYADQFEDPKAVIEASAWARERIGGPPKKCFLKPKASPRR